MKRVRGLKSLVQAAVEHGSRAVEKVQIEMAKTPFDILEKVPPLKVPVAGIRLVYNTGVSTTHGMIRLVNKVVGDTLDVVLDSVASGAGEGQDEPGKKAAPAQEASPPSAEATANAPRAEVSAPAKEAEEAPAKEPGQGAAA